MRTAGSCCFFLLFSNGCDVVPTMNLWASALSSTEGVTVPTGPDDIFQHRFLLGDIDGDGRVDLVDRTFTAISTDGATTELRGELHTFRSTGLNFEYAGPALAPDDNFHAEFGLADLSGDGRDDLLLYTTSQVAPSNGSGFDLPMNTPAAFFGAGDLTGDGLLDLATFDETGVVAVMTNLGAMTFSLPQPWTSEVLPNAVYVLRDLTHDGLTDVAVVCAEGVRVAQSTGSSLAPSALWLAYAPMGGASPDFGFADVTGDGLLDAIEHTAAGGTQVFPNAGGQFGPASVWSTASQPQFENSYPDLAAKADPGGAGLPLGPGGDGLGDFLVTGGSPYQVWASDGSAFVLADRFAPPTPDVVCEDVGPATDHVPCYTLGFGDVTGDGRDDVVYQAEDNVWVYSVPSTSPASQSAALATPATSTLQSAP